MSRRISFAAAIREGIEQEMDRVKDIVYFGIDVRQSPWGFTRDLVKKFGRERIVNTPIAESAIVGTGIGSAMMGLKVVSELMFEDFATLAMDHIYNNMGSWYYMTNGQYKVPLTVITTTGGGTRTGYGHSQALYPLFMSAPGIHVCVPSTPYDAKGLIISALRSDTPVVYSADRILVVSDIQGDVPEEEYAVPISGPPSAVSSQTEFYIQVIPGDTKKGQLVKDVLNRLRELVPDERAALVSQIPQEDMMRVLPAGGGKLNL